MYPMETHAEYIKRLPRYKEKTEKDKLRVKKIIEREQNRIIFENKEFVTLPDRKFKDTNYHCVTFVKGELETIRDLTLAQK